MMSTSAYCDACFLQKMTGMAPVCFSLRKAQSAMAHEPAFGFVALTLSLMEVKSILDVFGLEFVSCCDCSGFGMVVAVAVVACALGEEI